MKIDKIPLMVRLDGTIHKKIRYAAKKEARSLNRQIEYYVVKGLDDFETAHGCIPIEELEEVY